MEKKHLFNEEKHGCFGEGCRFFSEGDTVCAKGHTLNEKVFQETEEEKFDHDDITKTFCRDLKVK